jgi:hypothetical protein
MSHTCAKCHRSCKDKRGLAIHEKKCSSVSPEQIICEHCHEEFRSSDNLKKHIQRCKVLKEKETEEIRLQELRELEEKYEKQMSHLEEKFQMKIQTLERDCESKVHIFQEKCQMKIDSVKKDCESQIRLRDYDLNSFSSSLKAKDEEISRLNKVNEALQQQIEKARIEAEINKEEAFYHARQNRQTSTTYTNNVNQTNSNNTHNTFYIQVLDPSQFQGHIKPPSDLITDTNRLVKLLFDKGFGNYLRISDKSRNVALWNKPGEGLIRDPQCKQIVEEMISILEPDFIKQKTWLQEKIKQLESLPESNVSRYYTYLDFTNKMIEKSVHTMEQLRKQIGMRAKDKHDSSLDPIQVRSYDIFTNAFYHFFLGQLKEFVFVEVYEIGKLFGQTHQELFKIEGASQEKKYIILYDDKKDRHVCDETMLETIMIETLDYFFCCPQQRYINQLIELIEMHANRTIPFIHAFQTNTFTKELLRGIIECQV